MTEILFRGKRADSGEWVEGDLLQTRYHSGHIEYQIMPQTPVSSAYPVLSETIGQYTGLTDRNGTMIFEGDILASTIEIIDCNDEGYSISYGREDIGVVEYRRDAFLITHKPGNWARSFFGCDNYVLGNVFDNPELLDGGEGDG